MANTAEELPKPGRRLTEPAMIAASGFREYDARWRYPEDINLPGMTVLGRALGTQMFEAGIEPVIAVGHDCRAYSPDVKTALITGLVQAGAQVKDIGMALSPMAYFSQFHLDIPAVAMVTASHMKRRVRELGALAGFEKSGHYFLAEPIGRGYDCGMRVAVEICKLLDRQPDKSMSELRDALPRTFSTPTMSPRCADDLKYGVVGRITQALTAMRRNGVPLARRPISAVVTVNGARVVLDNGSWALVRASSNTPNLVVCESTESPEELKNIFREIEAMIRREPDVGDFDQTI